MEMYDVSAPKETVVVQEKKVVTEEVRAPKKKVVYKAPPKLHKWFHWSYLLDWLLIGVLLGAISGPLNFDAEPRVRFLSQRFPDANLDFPSLDSILSTLVVLLVDIFVVLVIVFIVNMIERCVWRKSWEEIIHDLHHALLSIAIAMILAHIWGDGIRYSVGRHRPDWYARLAAGDADSIRDARLSYPCGHCANAFAAMTFLCFFLFARLRTFRPRYGEVWRFCIGALPLVWATYVSITRIIDFHHHFADVITGAVIGAVCGVIAYHLQYHYLWSRWSTRPKKRYHDYEHHIEGEGASHNGAYETGGQYSHHKEGHYNVYHHNHHLYNDYNYY